MHRTPSTCCPAWAANLRAATVAVMLVAAGCDGGAPFDPTVDGFGFRNYGPTLMGSDEPVVNMTAVEMRRLFGDAVCDGAPTGDGCVLTPVAQRTMIDFNKLMDGGHCEGMAVLSARFHAGTSDPSAFGAARVVDLTPTAELQREIAYWFTLQLFQPLGPFQADGSISPDNPGRVGGDPRELAQRLRAALAAGEHHTLMFFNVGPDGRTVGGHAVTPYAVDDGEAEGEYLIRVYDNNFPRDTEKTIRVLADGSWEYRTAADPNAAEADYRGTATSNTLVTTELGLRDGMRSCFFCGNVTMAAARTIASSSGSVLVTDPMGRRVGAADGMMVNEIPGAGVQAIVGDVEDDVPPMITIPGGDDLTVTLRGEDEMQESSLGVTAAGYYLGVDDIALAPDQVDQIEFGGSYPSIVYTTSSMQTATVVLAIETETAGWVMQLRSRGQSDGQRVAAEIQLEDGRLAFGFTGNDGEATFDFALYRFDDGTVLEFGASEITVPSGSALQLDYATFDADGATLTLRIDVDGDGEADDEVNLADQPIEE